MAQSTGENLSAILQETVRLITKANYHLIIEEYDGETLTYDEAAKITKLFKENDLMESNIIVLAQPLMKKRSWSIGNENYERETAMFHELNSEFKIVKLEEVFRCSNEICEIIKSTQQFVRNKDSVFKTKLSFEQRQQPGGNEKLMVSPSALGSNFSDVETEEKSETSTNKRIYYDMDLDQAFKRSAPLQNINAAENKIVSKFGFLCNPRQGVDIKGMKPNLFDFSDIDLVSDIAVISLALVLKKSIGRNKMLTVLYLTDEQPKVLTMAIQLFTEIDKRFSYTDDVKIYLHKKKTIQDDFL